MVNRTKQGEIRAGRMSKRPRGAHLALIRERNISPPARYTQPTILDPWTISASTFSTPTDPSATSYVRVSTPIGNSQHQSSNVDRRRTFLIDEDTDGSDENGMSSDDVVATGSDAAATTFPGVVVKITGHRVPRFFRGQIKKKVDALWSYYSDVDPLVKDKIWESFFDPYNIVGGSIARARHIRESDNQKKWRDLLTKGKASALGITVSTMSHCSSGCLPLLDLGSSSLGAICQVLVPGGSEVDRHERRIGKTHSALNILLGLNKKKDKTTDEPEGEFYNANLEKAYEEYLILLREQYDEDLDPLQAPWVKTLWTQTEPVWA
ncbi:hypothetical protein LIER_39518 [Lithospermum erythrorhizon]|uniref:Uncharacterized protein n=1 Tax=Lithospermum erythrorhizon TaxID=34254 RepID=A0AAV3QIU7_LITER